MAEKPTSKPPQAAAGAPPVRVLPKPPAYRDPGVPPPAAPRPPLRRQPLPPSFRQAGKPRRGRRSARSCCCRICCFLFVAALLAAFILAVAGALAYLYFQPKLPSFHLEALNATAFTVRPTGAGATLDATVAARILVASPNGKIGVKYADGSARVSVVDDDGDVDVGTTAFLGFEQGRRNWTVVRLEVAGKGVAVDETAGSRLRSRYRSREIQFVVEVRTRVGFAVNGKSSGKTPIRVVCGPVSLRQGVSRGRLPKCRIYLLRWINLH